MGLRSAADVARPLLTEFLDRLRPGVKRSLTDLGVQRPRVGRHKDVVNRPYTDERRTCIYLRHASRPLKSAFHDTDSLADTSDTRDFLVIRAAS